MGIGCLSAYLAYPVAFRLRRSKYVKKAAIRISTTAATESDDVAIPCPPKGESVSLENDAYPYHEEFVTQHEKVNNMYAESE